MILRSLSLVLALSPFSPLLGNQAAEEETLPIAGDFELCHSSFKQGQDLGASAFETDEKKYALSYQIEDSFRIAARRKIEDERTQAVISQIVFYTKPLAFYIAFQYARRYAAPRLNNIIVPDGALNHLLEILAPVPGFLFNGWTVAHFIGYDLQNLRSWMTAPGQSSPRSWWNYFFANTQLALAESVIPEKDQPWRADVEVTAMRLKFESVRKELPKEHEEQADELLSKVEKLYLTKAEVNVRFEGQKYGGESDKKTVANYLQSIEIILNIPYKTLAIDKAKILPKVREVLSRYPENIRTKMMDVASGIEWSSKPEASTKKQTIRQFLYFLGAPGTGKTYLARKYAEALGLPFIEILATDLKAQMQSQSREVSSEEYREPSIFIKAIASLPKDQRYKNAVIFIDEIDKSLGKQSGSEEGFRSFLNALFDRNRKTVKVKELGIDIDVSKYTFIVAGNAPIAEKGDAFMSRMDTVDFGAMALTSRISIACREFGMKTGDLAVTDAELKNIMELARLDNGQNIGIRSLLNTVDGYVQYLSLKTTMFGLAKDFDFAKELDERSRSLWDAFSSYEILKRKFEGLEASFPSDVRRSVQKELQYIKARYLSEVSASKSEEALIRAQEYFKNLGTVLQIPGEIKNLAADFGIPSRLDALLEDYPENFRDVVTYVVQSHVRSSGEKESHKNVLYIHGKPGAGKTYFAGRLADALGLPLIELSLAGVSLKDLVGSPSYVGDGLPIRDKINHTLFTAALLGKNRGEVPVKNAVLFIDEPDKAVNVERSVDAPAIYDFLLRLTDTDRKEILLNDLGVSVDISKYLIVFAGNKLLLDPSSEELSPINDRLKPVEFNGFELKGKQSVVARAAQKMADEKRIILDSSHFDFVEKMVNFDHLTLGSHSLRNLLHAVDSYLGVLKKYKDNPNAKEFDYKKILRLSSGKKEASAPKNEQALEAKVQ